MSAAAPAQHEAIHLQWRPFAFPLPAPLVTAAGALTHRRGWLLRLRTASGALGWGEASPLAAGAAAAQARQACERAMGRLGPRPARGELERALPSLPPALAFALGGALAEADGLVGSAAGGWRAAPASAWLLPAGEEALAAARRILGASPSASLAPGVVPTFKWKVGVHPAPLERAWFQQLAGLCPRGARLRLDANGGLDRATAWSWVEALAGEGRLEWFEQPLDPADHGGLETLAERVPVALDESLGQRPELRRRWPGWQVRRPSQEGDPRPLLRQLGDGRPWLMVSTSFETGIGARWIAHLAALQAAGPTPTAPGLAPGWGPVDALASAEPRVVWHVAGEA